MHQADHDHRINRNGFRDSNFLFVAACTLLTVIGVSLRLHYIFSYDIWTDEITSVWQTTKSWGEFTTWYETPDIDPPLFYLYLRMAKWLLLGPDTVTTLRLLGAIWFPATAIGLTALAYKKRDIRTPALLTISFLASSPLVSYIDAELRMYGMMLCGSILLAFLVAHHLTKKAHFYTGPIYIGCTAGALLWTHYSSIALIAALFVVALVFRFKTDRRFDFEIIQAGLITSVLCVPLFPVLPIQIAHAKRHLYTTSFEQLVKFFALCLGPLGVYLLALSVLSIIAQKTPPPGWIQTHIRNRILLNLGFDPSDVSHCERPILNRFDQLWLFCSSVFLLGDSRRYAVGDHQDL